LKGHAEKDVGRLNKEVIKIPFANEVADPVDAAKKQLGDNVHNVKGKEKKRDFRQRVTVESVGMFEDGKKKKPGDKRRRGKLRGIFFDF